jgi:hypothetical protein
MLTFAPSWSIVFDLGVAAALVWLASALHRRRRAFRSFGRGLVLGGAVVLAAPMVYFGQAASLLASLVIVPWLAWEAYTDTEQPLPTNARRLLTGARIAVFVLVIICLLRPRLVFTVEQVLRSPAVVLCDVSTSMEGKDCPPAGTRYAALKAILEENRRLIDKIKEACDYRLATFGGEFQTAEEVPAAPTGTRTDLVAAFGGVMRDLRGAGAVGVVVITDGRHNGPGDPVAAARRLGVPVYPVCLGEERNSEAFADSSIQDVDCPERVFVKNAADVRIRVAYQGAATDQLIDVKLTADGKPVGSKRIAMPKSGRTEDIELRYTPDSEGIKRLLVSVTPAANDANTRNNTRELFVRSSKSALRALFIEGEVRWEYKFLRRAIAGAPNIKLMAVSAFLLDPKASDRLLPPDDRWDELSLIILGDIPASRFTPAQLARIRQFVVDGGSLLMLGGFNTLGPGGYAGTPVAKILPVDVRKADAQTLDAVQLAPTRDGLDHTILSFGPRDETRQTWKTLPPISGYTKISDTKPGAKVLVKSPKGDPILVIQEVERGRTAVFAADTTWRWIFNKGKYARYHKAFWRQLTQWLTKSGYGGAGGGLWVETDRLRYLTGDTPVLTVRAGGKQVAGCEIAAAIEGPGMKLRMPIGKGAGQYVLGLPKPAKQPGSYAVTATATPPPNAPAAVKPLTANTKFVVQELDIENANPGADPETLRAIAAAHEDGRFFSREEADKAFARLLERREVSTLSKTTRKELWDNLFVYIGLAGLLCVEWVVRKRKGLA